MAPKEGTVLAGFCLDILLYGILTVQLYVYYMSFPKDRRMTKVTVAFIYAVGTIQTVFALHDFYTIFVLPDPRDHFTFSDTTWSLRSYGFFWITIPLSGASVAAVSQLFYARRIHVLSEKKLIPGVVVVLALLQLVFGIFIAFTDYHNQIIQNKLFIPLDALAWELTGAVCDLVITIYMFRFLSRHIQQSFRPTRASLTRIKRLTLESGLITTGVALVYVVVSCTTTSSAFVFPGLALSKVYANSTLALLNGRFRIQGGRNEVDSDCVVNHIAMTERPPKPQQDESGPSVPILVWK